MKAKLLLVASIGATTPMHCSLETRVQCSMVRDWWSKQFSPMDCPIHYIRNSMASVVIIFIVFYYRCTGPVFKFVGAKKHPMDVKVEAPKCKWKYDLNRLFVAIKSGLTSKEAATVRVGSQGVPRCLSLPWVKPCI
jgi:hypothetical protein